MGDFEVAGGAGDYGYGDVGSFEEGGFVGAEEVVCGGFGKGAEEEGGAGSLGSLGVDDALAGDGGGDDGAVGGALDLLDGVYGGEADDGGTGFEDGVDGAVDEGGGDEGADGVVDEDDVVCGGLDAGERVGDGGLAGVSADDGADFFADGELGDLGLHALEFGVADGDEDFGDARDGGEGAESVDEDRGSGEREELLGSDTGECGSGSHSGTDAGGGEDYEDAHTV